ncbi:cyclin-J-like [Lytechinus variegatus]|uniref:cyclin-J-like n=1 Tax=Lytechinus variegatus TaxID=7654 RepID=UPI001BB183B6|nr:cyclin-J-like [Lytechinus variegatus]
MARLDQWHEDRELAVEVYASLCHEETRILPFQAKSPQLNLRRFLVDWLAIVSENLDIESPARHLAVYLLDRTMDRFTVSGEAYLQRLALVCLLIATKFEEKEVKVVKLTNLANQINTDETAKKEFFQMELLLLDFFDWNVSVPTALHFVDYFLMDSIGPNDLHGGKPLTNFDALIYLERYAQYFLEISLQDHTFSTLQPSLVAAICIAASRICLQLSPTWTNQLKKLTKYSWEQISPFIETMLKAHESDEKAAKRNTTVSKKTHHGYVTSTPASAPTTSIPIQPTAC